MTLKGLGSPPAFPTTFRDQDGQHQERKDGQWHTVKTDSEVLIDKLERRLTKLRERNASSGNPAEFSASTSSSEVPSESTDEDKDNDGLDLLSHAAPVASTPADTTPVASTSAVVTPTSTPPPGSRGRRFSSGSRIIELTADSSSEDDGNDTPEPESDHSPRRPTNVRPVTGRQTSVSFKETVRIHGGIRQPSSRNFRRPSALRQSSITSPVNLAPPSSPPPSTSLASSFNASLFSSQASSPSGSIYAPLTPANPYAPSPSRTLSMFNNRSAPAGRPSNSKKESYKQLIQQQQEEHAARRASEPGSEREKSWWSFMRRGEERDPLLPRYGRTKSEADVRFGEKPARWFTSDYWHWRLKQIYLACCGQEDEDEEEGEEEEAEERPIRS